MGVTIIDEYGNEYDLYPSSDRPKTRPQDLTSTSALHLWRRTSLGWRQARVQARSNRLAASVAGRGSSKE